MKKPIAQRTRDHLRVRIERRRVESAGFIADLTEKRLATAARQREIREKAAPVTVE